MTVLLTRYAAAKLTSSGSTVRSTLPSWTTSGALVVDIGSFRAMTQVISVSLRRGEAHSGRRPTLALFFWDTLALLPDGLCAVELYTRRLL